MTRRARVKVKKSPVTRKQAVAEFSLKKAKQRRKQWNRRVVMMGGLGVAAYALVGSWWLVHTGKLQQATEATSAAFWQWTAQAGMRVDQIYLEGRTHADAQEVKRALGIVQGAPILALSLEDMQSRLLAIPEIKSVTLTRALPNRIAIQITERVPVALWQRDGVQQLVDRDGVVLSSSRYRAMQGLPVIVGDDAPKHVDELVTLLESAPSIKPDVLAAVRVGSRRWNIQLKRDIVVMLPEDNPAAAWKRFATLVDEKALLAKAVRSIDMRMEDRVFIMPVEDNKSMITLTNARDT